LRRSTRDRKLEALVETIGWTMSYHCVAEGDVQHGKALFKLAEMPDASDERF